MSITFQTERCSVRPFTQADIGAFMVYHNDEIWMQYQGFKGLTREAYEAVLLSPPSLNIGLQLAILDTASGQLLGDLYLRQEGDDLWIGYTIAPTHARKGYAHEVLLSAIEMLRQKSYRTLLAGVMPGNTASIRLLEKAGFAHTATTPEELIYTLPLR